MSRWNENEGIVIKRRGNPKELTLEAVGLVDSQKTGMHYNELWFDDTWRQYDYIGAVWNWYDKDRVGNGGFSFRSKILLLSF